MRRNFFNLYNEVTAIDEEGSDCADDASSLENAAETACEVASTNVRAGRLDFKDHIIVLAENASQILTIGFGEAGTVLT